jgi:hypothetical protein
VDNLAVNGKRPQEDSPEAYVGTASGWSHQFDTVKLKQIGCSNSDDTVTVGEARNPPPNLNWFAAFGSGLLLSPLPQTLIVTLVVYVVVRAIGWVIGGFAAS